MMSLISLWCCGFLNFEHIQHIYQIFCYSPWTCVYALGFSNVKGCHALTFKRSPKGFIVFWVMTKVKNICNGLFKFTTHTLTIFIVSVLYHIHNVLENLLQILVKPLGPMKEYLYLLENLAFFRFFFVLVISSEFCSAFCEVTMDIMADTINSTSEKKCRKCY